uniref:TLC domain-containing protein n=1 Tax=Sander lucioperca TaxID=283035 RepID=A0A8C9XC49_SANLU
IMDLKWKWRNISTSLAYKCLCVAYLHTIYALNPLGYFIHDFLDVASNQSCKQSWEVLLHHSVVINVTPCVLAVTSQVYVGYSMVSLLVEINSVFIRQLRTNITGPRPSVIYSVTRNMYTRMPHYVLMMGTAGLSLISTINIVLFYRLLRADILTIKQYFKDPRTGKG